MLPALVGAADRMRRDADTANHREDTMAADHGPDQGDTPAAPTAGAKRKQGLQPGRNICWVIGCRCSTNLEGIPTDRVADATFIMQNEMGISFRDGERQRKLPENKAHNKLCPQHRPVLPQGRLIGAKVLLESQGGFVCATVTGPAPLPARRALPAHGVSPRLCASRPCAPWAPCALLLRQVVFEQYYSTR